MMRNRFVTPKVVLLGDHCTEKAEILARLILDYNHFDLPINFDVKCIKEINYNGIPIELNIYNTPSKEIYHFVIPQYMKGTKVAILLFSLINENSFINIKKYVSLIEQSMDELPVLFLVGNRNDLEDERIISFDKAKKASYELNAIYYEISSKTGCGIYDLFRHVAIESLRINRMKTLVIHSQKCNLNLDSLKRLKIDNPRSYMTFAINNGLVEKTQPMKYNDPEWNEPILLSITDVQKDVLYINMFNEFNIFTDEDIKLMNEIKIPVCKCTYLFFDSDIFLNKNYFQRIKIGHLSLKFEIIDMHENKTIKKTISDIQMPDEKEEKKPKIEFKIIDTETINKLLQKKKKIGSGATATVYKVKDIFKNKGVLAIKILNDTFFKLMQSEPTVKSKEDVWKKDDDDFDDDNEEENEKEIPIEEINKIYNEWEILSQICHPNIIKTYGFYIGDKSHLPSILLEYCKFNLKDAIVYLTNIDLVRIVYQICKAMQYLHDCKIIHRDLKVSNILINDQKDVKICDFGISRLFDVTSLTSMTHGIGTFIYMAPELFDIKSKLDEKIDVYAFGVVLYFIVTKGQIPQFVQNSLLQNYKIPKNVNKLSQSIIKKCWSFSSKDRPSFKSIIETIIANNFNLFNDINGSISSLGL